MSIAFYACMLYMYHGHIMPLSFYMHALADVTLWTTITTAGTLKLTCHGLMFTSGLDIAFSTPVEVFSEWTRVATSPLESTFFSLRLRQNNKVDTWVSYGLFRLCIL